MKRYEFVDKTVARVRELLEKNLPKEADLDEFIDKATRLIKEIYK
jgi:hypothetical protein